MDMTESITFSNSIDLFQMTKYLPNLDTSAPQIFIVSAGDTPISQMCLVAPRRFIK